jgi:hypothetical protein
LIERQSAAPGLSSPPRRPSPKQAPRGLRKRDGPNETGRRVKSPGRPIIPPPPPSGLKFRSLSFFSGIATGDRVT